MPLELPPGHELRLNSGASPASLEHVESDLNCRLPDDYREFLLRHDGGEGSIAETYLILYRASELTEMRDGYDFPSSAPGLIPFGSNGGGELFAFDTRTAEWSVVVVPAASLSHEDALVVAGSFAEFLKKASAPEFPFFE